MKPLFPFPTVATPFDLRVTSVKLDGVADAATSPVDDTLDVSGLAWDRMTLELELTGKATLPGADHRMMVVVRCASSNSRLATPASRSGLDPSRWTCTVEVPRQAVAQKVAVHATVAGTVDGVPHRYVAESEDLTIYVDQPAIPPITGALPIRWVRFDDENPDPPVLARFAKEPFYVHLDERQPVVFLNKSFPRLSGVITDRRLPAGASAVRDAVSTGIASQAWLAMFNAAAGEVLGDDDDVTEIPDGWKGDVLRRLLAQIYELESPEYGLAKLREAWETDGGATTQALLVGTVETHVGVGRRLRAALEGVKHELVNRGEAEPDKGDL